MISIVPLTTTILILYALLMYLLCFFSLFTAYGTPQW